MPFSWRPSTGGRQDVVCPPDVLCCHSMDCEKTCADYNILVPRGRRESDHNHQDNVNEFSCNLVGRVRGDATPIRPSGGASPSRAVRQTPAVRNHTRVESQQNKDKEWTCQDGVCRTEHMPRNAGGKTTEA